MRFAACVGAAGFPHFTETNVRLLRHIFGEDIPIIIRDDHSRESKEVEAVAARTKCFFKTEDTARGHFEGDFSCFMDAISLAQHQGADVAIKLSQRYFLRSPDVRSRLEDLFSSNTKLGIAMPGRPDPRFIRKGHESFARFPVLTDFMAFHVKRDFPFGKINAEWLYDLYVAFKARGTRYHHCFIEVFFHWLIDQGPLRGFAELVPWLTDHGRGNDRMKPLFLRRYQCELHEYLEAARLAGIQNPEQLTWPLVERAKMTVNYDPRPRSA